MWTVYYHLCLLNLKLYIGITKQKVERRWGKDGSGYKNDNNSLVFWNAIQKYGWNNFEHCIYASNLSEEEAKRMEILLIKLFKTNCKRYGDDYGYNMTDGGDGTSGYKYTEEQREAMRHTHTHLFESGENHPMFGKHQSEETKELNRQAHIGLEAPNRKKVRCIELNIVFDCIKDAANFLGIKSGAHISACCKGDRQICGGYHWEYVL